MLATNPVDPDYTFRFQTLESIGEHSHVQRTAKGGLGNAVGLAGAAALLVIGGVIGGVATTATVASADAPQPVERCRRGERDRRRLAPDPRPHSA